MRYHIAITGAGIGGLACAALLAADGHDVTLFERFAVPRALGSGLVIQPVGQLVLDRIGVGACARATSSPIRRMLGHSGRRLALDVAYPASAPGLGMHRARLFQMLWDRVAALGVPVITGAEVIAAPLDGPKRRLTLKGGEGHGPFDLIVDASGAASALSSMRARPLGYGAIWGAVPWPECDLLPDQLRQHYRGASRMAGVLPIGHRPGDGTREAAIFWSMPQAELDAWPVTPLEAWQAQVSALWPQMTPFLATITDNADMTVARYSHGTQRLPYAQALAHIGDAAHRASPQLGQGANMALLDALALALALNGPLDQALPDYAAMRRWHVRIYQMMSAVFTPMYQSGSRSLPWIRDLLAPCSNLPLVRGLLTHLVAGTMIAPLAGVSAP